MNRGRCYFQQSSRGNFGVTTAPLRTDKLREEINYLLKQAFFMFSYLAHKENLHQTKEKDAETANFSYGTRIGIRTNNIVYLVLDKSYASSFATNTH